MILFPSVGLQSLDHTCALCFGRMPFSVRQHVCPGPANGEIRCLTGYFLWVTTPQLGTRVPCPQWTTDTENLEPHVGLAPPVSTGLELTQKFAKMLLETCQNQTLPVLRLYSDCQGKYRLNSNNVEPAERTLSALSTVS